MEFSAVVFVEWESSFRPIALGLISEKLYGPLKKGGLVWLTRYRFDLLNT
jgi:hypothetical protein